MPRQEANLSDSSIIEAMRQCGHDEEHIAEVVRLARRIEIQAIGASLMRVVEDYYARKDRGERVKLKALADAAGVNYGSLRQAKFRYDAEGKDAKAGT